MVDTPTFPSVLKEFSLKDWHAGLHADLQNQAITALEAGKILYFPDLIFPLSEGEKAFLHPDCVKQGTKSIKYNPLTQKLWGTSDAAAKSPMLKEMMGRYAASARALIGQVLPHYIPTLHTGNTSFRPVEAEGRAQSARQDDTRLHVDAFPSRPNHGHRLLRVFSNIHPSGKARHWKAGEDFANLAERFLPTIPAANPFQAWLWHRLGITKAKRSAYDHIMLHMHDKMKYDESYQKSAPQENVFFAAGSSWIVFTDQVPHAALGGQHALEQTFTLPPEAMMQQGSSPLRILEKLTGKPLT